MRPFKLFLAVFACLSCLAAAAPAVPDRSAGQGRVLDILPSEGLDEGSVVVFRDQKALDAHYFLADETVLGLDGKAEAAFAMYRAEAGEALLLVVAYPSEEGARRAYDRFGRHFFRGKFDPQGSRHLERIETGDYAAAVRTARILIVVLEAPDRRSCEDLLRRAEAGAARHFSLGRVPSSQGSSAS